MQETKEPLSVYLRVRPLDSIRKTSVVELLSNSGARITAPKSSAAFKAGETEETFFFSGVFAPESGGSQQDVYDRVARPIVASLVSQDAHGLIFSFGVTNSGKSYTIHGTPEEPGLIPRALRTVFDSIRRVGPESERFPVDDANYKYAVVVNYLEIYNELIFDLLADYSRTKLDAQKEALELKMDSKDRVGVRGLKDVTCVTLEQALAELERGRQNRQVAETKLNTDSSRSHSIFTIKLCTVPREHVVSMDEIRQNPGKYVRYTKLSVVDLAGSERAKRTNNHGARLVEANNINQSLMTFKRCVEALRHNQLHPTRPPMPVPFRDSKMTRLFQDYFSGVGRAAMIVNVNPQVSDYDETARVLKFSAMAQELRTTVSRIDTGRAPTKTKSRVNTAAFEGSVSGLVAEEKRPAAAAVAAPAPAPAAAAEEACPSPDDLRQQLAEALAANVRLEAQIRDEVASEFAQEIFRNQLQCEERVADIREAIEEKYERKIQILDELNKTSMQRHVAKYQELVEEYNSLADECEAKEAELQKKLDGILAAKQSGSAGKYGEVIRQLEAENKQLRADNKELNARLVEQETQSQQWKKQVGSIAETKIVGLEQEVAQLREALREKDGNKKPTVRSVWQGLKKKQRSGEMVVPVEEAAEPPPAIAAEDAPPSAVWANVSLELDDDKHAHKAGAGGKKKFGSWRKKRANAEMDNPEAAENVAVAAAPAAPPKQIKRQESDSLRLTEVLGAGDGAQNRSALRVSAVQVAHAGDYPVIVPASKKAATGLAGAGGRKAASKYLF